jgi:putative flippase GtrA
MGPRFRAMAAPIQVVASRFMFARYLLASICALSSDMILFLGLTYVGLWPVQSAFAGYAAGLMVHWMISSRYVFGVGEGSHRQRAGFVASALVGMALTVTIVAAVTAMGGSPALGKLLSVPASFLAVYAIRKHGVFARR